LVYFLSGQAPTPDSKLKQVGGKTKRRMNMLEKVIERIKRDMELVLKKKDNPGYVVWLAVTLLLQIMDDLELKEEPHSSIITDCLGEVLDCHAKFLKLKQILGIDTK
jgi:hypothetical protein